MAQRVNYATHLRVADDGDKYWYNPVESAIRIPEAIVTWFDYSQTWRIEGPSFYYYVRGEESHIEWRPDHSELDRAKL